MDIQNVKTIPEVKQYLRDQQTKYNDQIRKGASVASGQGTPSPVDTFLTPEGIDRQVAALHGGGSIWFGELDSSNSRPNLTFTMHQLEVAPVPAGSRS